MEKFFDTSVKWHFFDCKLDLHSECERYRMVFSSWSVGKRVQCLCACHLWYYNCMLERGRELTGEKSHWCPDWDYMTVDETTPEFESCLCFK